MYGTKKVNVKAEKGEVKVRVGGGYLSVASFMEQYHPVELEKLQRND